MSAALAKALQQAGAQLRASRLLRWGLVLILALLWNEALLRGAELAQQWQQEAETAQGEVARLQSYQREQQWPNRANDARQLLDAQERLLWLAPSAGLAEAAVQDWLRGVAGKARVNVRELQVSRLGVPGAGPPPAAPAASAPLPVPVIRAHLVGEFRRMPVLALLNEVAVHERTLVVERLLLLPGLQAPSFELDLRAVVAPPPRAP